MRRVLVILILIAAAAAGGGYWWYTTSQAAMTVEPLSASGSIEAEQVSITAEVGGRIVELNADEGDEVTAGQVLVQLDTAILLAQKREALAAVDTARANLAQVQAGPRAEEVAIAEAALAQAETARDGAKQAWQDALRLRDNPQQLDAQIDQARTQVKLAEENVDLIRAQLALLRDQHKQYEFVGDDRGKTTYQVLGKQIAAAEAAMEAAQAQLAGAQQHLANLLAMRDDPLVADSQVNAAKAAYDSAVAAVGVAQAALDALREGPMPEEVAVAEAQVAQAEAALELLNVQLDKMTLRSPLDGLITSRTVHAGETAAPGATLLTVADLTNVTLTVYIPEDEIGKVKVGQPVKVTVDSFPGQVFEGTVSYIASEAEFTPKNVQTKKERVNMVFAVKVTLPNPTHDLKPGMPADAEFAGE